MSAEALPSVMPSVDDEEIGYGGTFWQVVTRDPMGHPIELRQMHDVAIVHGPDGEVIGFSVGCHPSRGLMDPMDVIFRPAPPEPAERHQCAMLAELDCYAALGDVAAVRLARWHADHPDGPQTPEEYAEETAVRAGFAKRATRQ